jgi:hypothetical protein
MQQVLLQVTLTCNSGYPLLNNEKWMNAYCFAFRFMPHLAHFPGLS